MITPRILMLTTHALKFITCIVDTKARNEEGISVDIMAASRLVGIGGKVYLAPKQPWYPAPL